MKQLRHLQNICDLRLFCKSIPTLTTFLFTLLDTENNMRSNIMIKDLVIPHHAAMPVFTNLSEQIENGILPIALFRLERYVVIKGTMHHASQRKNKEFQK